MDTEIDDTTQALEDSIRGFAPADPKAVGEGMNDGAKWAQDRVSEKADVSGEAKV